MSKNYLKNAVINSYNNYKKKGLYQRAQPFILNNPPLTPKKLLVVGVALGGKEEINSLNKYFPKYDIYGIDVVKEALNQEISNATLIYSDIAKLKFKNNYFSGILCSAVMHEVYSYSQQKEKRVKKAISEASRCLTKNGVFVIREFYVPEEFPAKIIFKTEKAKEFSKKFIQNFRKELDPELKNNYTINKNGISGNISILYEIMLHFRVMEAHYKTFEKLLKSKEIEERYTAIQPSRYLQFLSQYNLHLIQLNYIDFPHYTSIIKKHFKILNKNGNEIYPKFGFIDIISRKI